MAAVRDELLPVVLSERFEVIGFGMRATAYDLQRAGWQCSVDQSMERMSFRCGFLHHQLGMLMLTEWVDIHWLRSSIKHPSFMTPALLARTNTRFLRIERILHKECTVPEALLIGEWTPFDARPSMVTSSWSKFNIEDATQYFRPIAVPEEREIIVGPQNVQEALDLILQLQKEDQKVLREKARNQPRQVHAQLVSLAA